MPASGKLSLSEVVVVPGEEELLSLVVRNVGSAPESFSIVATGFVQGWTIIDPPMVSLVPGGEEKIGIALRPPRRWSVPAGPSPLSLRIVSHDAPDEVAIAEGTVTVLAYDDRRLSFAQSVQRGRRRAEFDVVLENLGNARSSCRVAIIDPSARLSGRFDPPSLGVDPGDGSAARLTVRARRRNWRQGSRPLPFEVHALQEGHPTAIASGTLLQDPLVAGRTFGRAAAVLVAVGALIGAWFGVGRPAIDRAAERAVAQAATNTTVAPDPTASVPAVTGRGSGALGNGQAFDTRLSVSTALGQQGVQSFTVPDGKVLRVTDVLWQNPNGDEGKLELLRNSTVLYGISLRNFTDYANALVSPYVFESGDVVTAQLTCERIGDPSSDSCSAAITLSGELDTAP